MAKKTGLGRGLDALFADAAPVFENDAQDSMYLDDKEEAPKEEPKAKAKPAKADAKGKVSSNKESAKTEKKPEAEDLDRVIYIDLNDIKPNAAQPRKHFDEEKLEELAASIKENGVIQPLIVRQSTVGYELVAGERRWRASRIAGLKKVPAIIRNFDEKQNAIVAIIENMQREDLDAIEEAAGLMAMTKKYGFTQEQVSTALGKSRAYIANSLRLLKLPEEVQQYIIEGKISAAHGRTIINVGDKKTQLEICEKIIKGGLSVRATEKLADKVKDEAKPERKKRKKTVIGKTPEILAVEDELRKITGTKVNINGNEAAGKIELEYYSLEELNRLIEAIREGF
ncbi:MAG: ParB/RepB/Spo0J family partition protein [Clostridiales bacterium]|nr:ParB/RepB/Spo0J family partition protein [Candidatus Crickella merdequi]